MNSVEMATIKYGNIKDRMVKEKGQLRYSNIMGYYVAKKTIKQAQKVTT